MEEIILEVLRAREKRILKWDLKKCGVEVATVATSFE
jgi:hypothetical protein